MDRLVSIAVGVLLAVAVGGCGGDEDGGEPTVKSLADALGVYVGAGFVEGSHTDEFREVLRREYNSVTAPLYWSQSEPRRGEFDFAAADRAMEVAEAGGLRVRGHPLVWGRLALPEWVNRVRTPGGMRGVLENHVSTIVGRFRGRIAQYDVVNEPLTLFGAPGVTGDAVENYCFTELLGRDYIRLALEAARAADPDAELYVNENLVLAPGPKQDFFFELIEDLVEEGAPLDGVGFQGHLAIPFAESFVPTRAEIAATIDRFAALGLDVEITEVDVTLMNPETELEYQANVYRDLTEACFSRRACRGITTWGISDAYTWIEDFFDVRGAPLPFDEDFVPKPAWFAIRDGLQAVR